MVNVKIQQVPQNGTQMTQELCLGFNLVETGPECYFQNLIDVILSQMITSWPNILNIGFYVKQKIYDPLTSCTLPHLALIAWPSTQKTRREQNTLKCVFKLFPPATGKLLNRRGWHPTNHPQSWAECQDDIWNSSWAVNKNRGAERCLWLQPTKEHSICEVELIAPYNFARCVIWFPRPARTPTRSIGCRGSLHV